MSSDYDATEFVDGDFRASSKVPYPGAVSPPPSAPAVAAPAASRAPSREEVDVRVGETQQKLAELKRIQEELERERSSLEETRRRQIEFQTGRQESLQNLARAIGLLTEAEFASRRDAEQMAKALADLQVALEKVEATNEQSWTKENFSLELTRALTVLENARMEYNSARLKFPILSGINAAADAGVVAGEKSEHTSWLAKQSLGDLCKMGLAMTWPVALAILAVGMLMIVFLRR
jgi:hypothetical protein